MLEGMAEREGAEAAVRIGDWKEGSGGVTITPLVFSSFLSCSVGSKPTARFPFLQRGKEKKTRPHGKGREPERSRKWAELSNWLRRGRYASTCIAVWHKRDGCAEISPGKMGYVGSTSTLKNHCTRRKSCKRIHALLHFNFRTICIPYRSCC